VADEAVLNTVNRKKSLKIPLLEKKRELVRKEQESRDEMSRAARYV
jgi:hypothetical protein